MIDGLPSPSVAKMAKMNITQLEEHIAKLTAESGHLEKRIERLAKLQPPNEQQTSLLRGQLSRLQTLIGLAQQHLKDKHERKGQWDMGQRPQRGFDSGFGGSRPSGGYGGGSRPSGGYGGGGGRGGPSRGRPRW